MEGCGVLRLYLGQEQVAKSRQGVPIQVAAVFDQRAGFFASLGILGQVTLGELGEGGVSLVPILAQPFALE